MLLVGETLFELTVVPCIPWLEVLRSLQFDAAVLINNLIERSMSVGKFTTPVRIRRQQRCVCHSFVSSR
jgi:hypothetical protein